MLLKRAWRWQRRLDRGTATWKELEKAEGVSRARVTQILGLLRLAPWVQEMILAAGRFFVLRLNSGNRKRWMTYP